MIERHPTLPLSKALYEKITGKETFHYSNRNIIYHVPQLFFAAFSNLHLIWLLVANHFSDLLTT